jgi:UDP-glucose:(heptosyl)LPS alpha-1,3-glucosyltransferase
MRVALVYPNFNLHGSLERDSVLLAQGLARRGVEVHCYCNPRTREIEGSDLVFHDVTPLTAYEGRVGHAVRAASFAAAATKLLRRHRDRYDVIDVRQTSAWEHDVVWVHAVTAQEQRRSIEQASGTRATKGLRTLLAPVAWPRNTVVRGIERRQFRPGAYRRLIAITSRVRDDLVRVHDVPPGLVEIVPLPIDSAFFRAVDGRAVRRSLGIDASAPVVLFAGHSFERKGLADAIDAVAPQAAAHLIVVGGGDPTPYRARAERRGAGRRVHFVGITDKPERYFAAADVFLLPSRHDPWGITVIEALAAGVPAIVSEVVGSAALVRTTGAGIVVPVGDKDAARAALELTLAQPDARRVMAERGRASAKRFSLDHHVDVTLDIYARCFTESRRSTRHVTSSETSNRSRRIASLPNTSGLNPYSSLLNKELERQGFEFAEGELRYGWLWAARESVAFLHFNWPEGHYFHNKGPRKLRPMLSWLKLGLFVSRLALARALDYRLVWTIHQVYPHESSSRCRDHLAAVSLSRLAHVLLAHDNSTAEQARATLSLRDKRIDVVSHGSYRGVYRPGRTREEVRRELGVGADAFCFLSFGELRGHKALDVLVDAFRTVPDPGIALVIAGRPKNASVAARLREASHRDRRIKVIAEYVPDDRVAELFEACDVAVVARGDGGTSGSLILALSMARPTIAADMPAYRHVTVGRTGWFFEPGTPSSLAAALREAARDPKRAAELREVALEAAEDLSWEEAAHSIATRLREVV